ncbi:S-layer protein RsaA [Thauera humireducens]|uniref:DUF4214 domain-containing protein n=1 Tax=Thauera humireducens TaxID=1134435 RepID=UPI002467A8E5|nr:DUF4214 domain-containing protein [Thauera humireducens]CAH1746782.1 S-layer protein RsaA [Thauera humireducens]
MALTVTQIQNAYVAFFNRPADVAGLTYWSSYAGGVSDLLDTFAQSAEYQSLYANMNSTQLVNAVYTNLFNRAPDVAGLNYWVSQLDNGALSIGNIADAINKGAQGTDAAIIANKVEAAVAFTNALDTTEEIVGYASVSTAGVASVKAWLNTVTSDAASVTTATGTAMTTLISGVVSGAATNPGETFTLTTNADSVTGTSGNDTFNGTNTTLQATDVIRGGEGRDTLNYTDASVGGTNLPVADIAGVEVINVRNVGSGAAATSEVATFTFGAVAGGGTVTITPVGGVAVTYDDAGQNAGAGSTGAQVAAYFAANLPAGYQLTSVAGAQLVLTGTPAGNAADLVLGGTAAATQTVGIVQGTAAGAVATNTFSAANLIGAEEFNTVNSIGAVTVTNLAAGQSLGMVGNGATTVGALTGTYGATVTSTTLNLKDGLQTTTVAGAPVGAGAVVINGAALATATVNSTGAANAVADLDFGGGAALTTLNINATSNFGLAAGGSISGFSAGATSTINVTGSGAVRVNALDAALDVYNASTATGAQTLSLGAATQQVTLGSGNDVVTTNNIGLTTGSVAAGAGAADRLVLTASADINTLAEGARYSGFEQVQIENGQALDLDLLAANNTIDTIRLNNIAGTADATNLNATQAANVQIVNAAAGLITIGVKNANDGGQIDTVKAALTTTTAAGAAQNINLATAPISLSGVEKLELTGNGTVAATTGTVTLNTAAAISLDSIKLANAGNGNIITIAAGHAATNLVVDASASTGNTTIDAGLYATLTGATLKGGSGNDVLIGSVRVDSLSGGNGRDLFDFDTGAGVGLSRSTAAATDKIADFGKITTAVSDVTGLTLLTFQNAGEVRGGANADVIDLSDVAAARATVVATATDVAAASGNAALDIKATLDARGLLTLTGADAAEINTVAEVLAVFNGLNGVAGGAGVFNLNGNAIVIQENAAGVNAVVELTGVTLTGVSIIGAAGTGLVGEAFII